MRLRDTSAKRPSHYPRMKESHTSEEKLTRRLHRRKQKSIIQLLTAQLSTSWSFEVFYLKIKLPASGVETLDVSNSSYQNPSPYLQRNVYLCCVHTLTVLACNCWIYVAQEQRSATQSLAKHHHWCLFSKDMRWWNQYSKLPWTLVTRRFLQSILLLLCFAPNCTPTDAPSLVGASLRCYFSAGQDKDSLSSWRTFILLLVEGLFSRVLKGHPKQMP